ncbi:hypothetical protein Ancab_020592 [Ancistrocladus abbreviatus]
MSSCSSNRRSLKALLVQSIALLGCCFLLWLAGVIASRETRASVVAPPSHLEVTGQGRLVVQPKMDFNSMSKRKVPNGPDPIHNRRAGNSRQPPGQA